MATVLITGTNKGVGLELTKIYAGRGDRVYAACRDPESATELKAVEGDVHLIEVVVGDTASVTRWLKNWQALPLIW
jgi:NAD(P)-dependent dehydrogenase (short-subunit alcohol dehydrogenase family)